MLSRKLMTASASAPAGLAVPTLSVAGSVSVSNATSVAADMQEPYAYVTDDKKDGVVTIALDLSTFAPTVWHSLYDGSNLNGATPIAVQGDRAYVVARNVYKLAVVNIANPGGTFVEAAFSTSPLYVANALDLAVSGDHVYVAAYQYDRLAVFDVSDPAAPALAGSSAASSAAMNGASGVAVSGSYAYVTGKLSDSLAVVDVSTPSAPTIVGSVSSINDMDSVSSVAVAGSHAFVTSPIKDKVTVIDVSNPASPAIVGSLTDSAVLDGCHDIEIYGSYAFVAGSQFFSVLDISDPASPTIIAAEYLGSAVSEPRLSMGFGVQAAFVARGNQVTVVKLQ